MDRLEESKSQDGSNPLLQPNDAAQAHVQNFALATFARADNAIHSDHASRQTVETFQAASNFMELLSVFGPLDAEISAKIKYAKYHALRIVKAIRAGEDPNLSNPVQADQVVDASSPYQSPTVESAPDSMQPSRTPSTIQAVSLAAAPPSGTQTPNIGQPAASPFQGVSPIEDPLLEVTDDKPTNYPQAPPPVADSPPTSVPPSMSRAPESFYAPPAQPPQNFVQSHVPQPTTVPQPVYSTPSQPQQQPASTTALRSDDEALASAQKHAKWAISALNFEDVNTAVKELRIALQALGAS